LGTGAERSKTTSAAYAFDTVKAPTFSPAGGFYATTQTVTISCATPGATIHYTTDGSNPTAASPTYTVPISVPIPETVRAIAVANGDVPSPVASSTYSSLLIICLACKTVIQ
jgi:hypothetical protein